MELDGLLWTGLSELHYFGTEGVLDNDIPKQVFALDKF